MHPQNPHLEKYDLDHLATLVPELKEKIITNKNGLPSINFSDPDSVRLLNEGLLKGYHGIEQWHVDKENLTPAVPGRCDHLLYLYDFLKTKSFKVDSNLKILDIGTGASCIYPILGTSLFKWQFVASESNTLSYRKANALLSANPKTSQRITLRLQKNNDNIFTDIIRPDEVFAASICNPPFYRSVSEAKKENRRKTKNLKTKSVKNFSGLDHEFWYPGGEYSFILKMIDESKYYKKQVHWYTSLVAKETNLKRLIRYMNTQKKLKHEVISFKHGNKTSRLLAWQST